MLRRKQNRECKTSTESINSVNNTMAQPTFTTKVLIFTTFIVYVIHLILNGLSARGGPDSKLFPNTVSNVSQHFHLEITPVGATFTIWGVIFAYQLAWLFYAISTVFRDGGACNILSNRFFVSFILNIFFISTWLFVWARKEAVASFVVIVLGQIFLDAAIVIACIDLRHFLNDQRVTNKTRADVWSHRILVQNGLLFYGTWTTIATLINLAVVVSYSLGSTTFFASMLSLTILGVLAIIWFVLENFVFQKYTEYSFTAYIVLIVGLTGILVNIWEDDKRVGGFVLALLILSIVFLIARIAIIIVRAKSKTPNKTILHNLPLENS